MAVARCPHKVHLSLTTLMLAVGVGFAIGPAAIGSGVGQGIALGRCIDGISRQPEAADGEDTAVPAHCSPGW